MSEEIAGLYVSIGADMSGLQVALDETRFQIEDLMAEGGLLGGLPLQTVEEMQNMMAALVNALAPLPGMIEAHLRKPIIDVMNSIRATITQIVNQIVNELYAAASLIHGVASGLGLPSPINMDAIPGRAEGGPVRAGSTYLVGEAGPELFVPGANGQIIPNHAMSGGGLAINGGTFVIQGVQDVGSLYDALQRIARQRGA
jgi:hypothetical protein